MRVNLLGSSSSSSWPGDGDATILHPRDENTARVSAGVLPRQGAVHQSSQCWKVGLDLPHDAGQTSLSETINVLEVWMSVLNYGGNVQIQIHCALLQVSSWQVLQFLQRVRWQLR